MEDKIFIYSIFIYIRVYCKQYFFLMLKSCEMLLFKVNGQSRVAKYVAFYGL